MNSTLTHPPAELTETIHSDRLPTVDLAGIAALGPVIAIHTSELSGKIEETAYLGFGYVLLIAASIVSIVLLARRDLRGWTRWTHRRGNLRRVRPHPNHRPPGG